MTERLFRTDLDFVRIQNSRLQIYSHRLKCLIPNSIIPGGSFRNLFSPCVSLFIACRSHDCSLDVGSERRSTHSESRESAGISARESLARAQGNSPSMSGSMWASGNRNGGTSGGGGGRSGSRRQSSAAGAGNSNVRFSRDGPPHQIGVAPGPASVDRKGLSAAAASSSAVNGPGRSKRDREREKEKIWQSIWGDEEEEGAQAQSTSKPDEHSTADAANAAPVPADQSSVPKASATPAADTTPRSKAVVSEANQSKQPKQAKARTASASSTSASRPIDASSAASLLQRMGTTQEQLAQEYESKKTADPAAAATAVPKMGEPARPEAKASLKNEAKSSKPAEEPKPASQPPASPARGSAASRWAPSAGSEASRWAPRQENEAPKSEAGPTAVGKSAPASHASGVDQVDELQERVAKIDIQPPPSSLELPPGPAETTQIVERPSTPPPRKIEFPPSAPFTPSSAIDWADEDEEDEASVDFVKEMAAQWGIEETAASGSMAQGTPLSGKSPSTPSAAPTRKILDPITEASSKDPSPPSEPNVRTAPARHTNSRSRGHRGARPPAAQVSGRGQKVELLGTSTVLAPAPAPPPSKRQRPRPVPAGDAFARLSGGMLRGARGGPASSSQRSPRDAAAADEGGKTRVKGRGSVKATSNN